MNPVVKKAGHAPSTNTKKAALGRGLAALLPERKGAGDPSGRPASGSAAVAPAGPAAPFEIELSRLSPNRQQPRTDFDEAKLEELARSIRSAGILQPIVVEPVGSGNYMILMGERRFRAAQKAGLTKVPVILHGVDSERARLETQLIENLQRTDLNPMEAAESFRRLRDEHHLSQEEIAAKIGRDRSSVANTLRLLRLPVELQAHLRTGDLSFGHAKAILGLEKDADRLRLGEEVVARGLSVRETEQRVAARPETGSDVPRAVKEPRPKDVHTREAEEALQLKLRMKVEIVRKSKGGHVRLFFGSEPELMRLYDILVKASES